MINYRKSKASISNGACIEVGNDDEPDNYRKSNDSMANGNCVEVGSRGVIVVRDTTDRTGPVVKYSAEAWEVFTAKIKKN